MYVTDNLASSKTKTKTAGDDKVDDLISSTFPTNETTLSQGHLLKERNEYCDNMELAHLLVLNSKEGNAHKA